ncbi:MAG: hypothetical protein HYV33_03930 [Candidatus Kerfeldbacteria bacterium]|nr:hypothetical protein [Candidatus Kerfeldbacteria bacterium]
MTKQCTQCSKTFHIDSSDQAFYDRINVPAPTFCPSCRLQRRLSFRVERNIYQRTCDLTGKPILSVYNTTRPYPVYDIAAWWTDRWSPLTYGRDFDFKRLFFDQFSELQVVVPRLALIQQQPMENSAYCNAASRNKNCYLVFSTNQCEDCYYGSWVNSSKNCVDNYSILRCELCYQCIDCKDCYHCWYAQDSRNCTDSYFIKSCIGCRNIAFCTNLVNAEYCLFNQAVTKQVFEEFVQQLRAATSEQWNIYQQQYMDLRKKMFMRYYQGVNNEASTGHHINNCKNCRDCFLVDASENIRYGVHLEFVKDAMDYSYWGQQAEQLYEVQASGYNITNLKFCNLCWSGCENLEYCDHSFSSKNCFGCVGLKKNEYCILNKQYTATEYERLVDKIKQYMRTTKEYGEFFPMQLSPFDYNETLAQEFFPLTETDVQQRGWRWKNKDQTDYQAQTYQLPDRIEQVNDDILQATLACRQCTKNYRIVAQELVFYRQEKLLIPRLCPNCRHLDRLAQRPKYDTWTRQCMCTQPEHNHNNRCVKEFVTPYSPNQPELIYCEDCYKKQVY